MNKSLLKQIAELSDIGIADLKKLWREYYPDVEPPANSSRILMIRRLTYRLQEISLGGLPDDVQKRLHELRGSVPTILNPKRKCLPPPGTNLVREYQGITHRVTVLYEGFEYEGRKYDNLSIIARLITGTRWSGPLFFGLKS
jgi:hypothetical protein